MIRMLLLTLSIVLLLETPAYAYLDPGTGSMILQGLAGAFFFGLFFFKQMWGSVVRYFRKVTAVKGDDKR